MNTTMRTTAAAALLASLALAGCATTAPAGSYNNSYNGGYNNGYSNASCYDCGTVQSIENVGRTPNATGAVLGGLVGGVLGNQIGGGSGRTAATVLGAVGGAVAGNAIEGRMNQGYTQAYRISIQLDQGGMRAYDVSSPGDLRVGDRVRLVNGQISRY